MAPPVEEPVIATVDETCPDQFSLCLDVDAGLSFEHNLRASRRWMKEAWSRCAVLPDGGTDSGVRDGGL